MSSQDRTAGGGNSDKLKLRNNATTTIWNEILDAIANYDQNFMRGSRRAPVELAIKMDVQVNSMK